MRNLLKTLSLPLALVGLLALGACDSGEQTYDTVPGDSLIGLRGPSEVAVPNGEASFNIYPYTIEKEYTWMVTGPDGEEIPFSSQGGARENEYIDLSDLDETGTYTVSIDDGEYAGETTFEAFYPEVVSQASRYGFDGFVAAIGEAELEDTLGTDGPFTIFAPTDDALADALGTTGEDGDLVLPAPGVLADILSYHVALDSLPADELDDPVETLEGGQLMFDTSGDEVQVIDGTDATNPATITEADIPASNGVVHGIDALRLPATASVAFNDQTTSGDTVTVRSVYVPRDGYVAIHDSTLLGEDGEPFTDDDQPISSVIGVSEYIEEPGVQNDLQVVLFDVPGKDFDEDMTLAEDQPLIAMPHEETNGNAQYNFITSEGSEDIPYFETEDGEQAVVSIGAVTVESEDDN